LAQALNWEWMEAFETEIRGEELHPALALIFALVDTPRTVGRDT